MVTWKEHLKKCSQSYRALKAQEEAKKKNARRQVIAERKKKTAVAMRKLKAEIERKESVKPLSQASRSKKREFFLRQKKKREQKKNQRVQDRIDSAIKQRDFENTVRRITGAPANKILRAVTARVSSRKADQTLSLIHI